MPSAPQRPVIARLAAAVTGPRGRWVVVAAWALLAVAGFLGRARIDDVTAAGQSSFLPADSESTRALDALQHSQNAGEEVPTVVVFQRDGGLTKADRKAIGRIGDGLNALRITGATPIVDPFSADSEAPLGDVAKIADGIGPISRDGEAALVVLAIDAADRGAIVAGVKEIRAYLAAHAVPGLNSYVTGPGGIAADLEQVADEAGQTLLIATLSLVLILLLFVYRAPPLALLPLLTVGVAYMVATGIAYLLIEAGAITVNTEGTFLLLVLIFGAGTDYSLLLVHRYREELGKGLAPEVALPAALGESVPAIAASGGTVIAAMLVLLVANLQSTHWLGPILAIGIAVMLAAAFTLLPALLALLGERAFWPAQAAARRAPHSRWVRIAELVRRRSRLIVLALSAGLVALALGNLVHHGTIGFLILTVVGSFAATLGLCTALFSFFGSEGIAFDLVLLSFLFLVALGVDYNIFLMTRAREEAAERGTREGILAALVSTGGVVTGAGLILAGTFATLTLLPLEELVQIGATVAIGVLLDTFVVRALLIPAITYRLGARTWWPSSEGAGVRARSAAQ